MVGRRDEPALVHSVERRTMEALLADLDQGPKVHQDATGIVGPWEADRPQVVERREQSMDSLQLGAENRARRVVLVARAAAREMVWELQPERRDGPLRERVEPLAQREHRVSTPPGLAWLQQLDEPLREREHRARLAAAAQSSASQLFRLVRELEQQLCRQSRGQLRQAKLLVPMRQQEARQALQPGAISQLWPSPVFRLRPRLPGRRPDRSACARAQDRKSVV